MKEYKRQTRLGEVGTAIGIGLIAGFAGTMAMTLCQAIDMKMSGRKASDTPASAVREALDIKPVTESKSQELSTKVHWVYGTSLGLVRGVLSLSGLKGVAASSLHFVSIWAAQLIMLPSLRVAPPVTKEKPREIAKDAFFHMLYAATAGCVFDAINRKK